MLSDDISAFIKNATQLCVAQGIELSQPIGFAEQWEEQGDSRRIDVKPVKARGAGPEFVMGGTATGLNGNVRKKWTSIQVRCCGLPASKDEFPNLSDQLLHNTDDTEALEQIAVVAMNQAVPGRYRYLGSIWNQHAEVMMYGRCLVITFEVEQPIANIQPWLTEAIPTALAMTAQEEAPQ